MTWLLAKSPDRSTPSRRTEPGTRTSQTLARPALKAPNDQHDRKGPGMYTSAALTRQATLPDHHLDGKVVLPGDSRFGDRARTGNIACS
jgi:hypothetical protein